MTKEQFKGYMIQTGWKQDGDFPNRLTKGNAYRCALHRTSYKLERYSLVLSAWVIEQTEKYSKVK